MQAASLRVADSALWAEGRRLAVHQQAERLEVQRAGRLEVQRAEALAV
jgi:hypothetical protein